MPGCTGRRRSWGIDLPLQTVQQEILIQAVTGKRIFIDKRHRIMGRRAQDEMIDKGVYS